MMLEESWVWRADIGGGVELDERQMGSIRAVPALLVKKLFLVNLRTDARVCVDMLNGSGMISLPGGDMLRGGPVQRVPPKVGFAATEPKVALFFRRKAVRYRPESVHHSVEFRAVGYVIFRGDQPYHIAALRVYDDRIEKSFYTVWPSDTAKHVASRAAMVGGA